MTPHPCGASYEPAEDAAAEKAVTARDDAADWGFVCSRAQGCREIVPDPEGVGA